MHIRTASARGPHFGAHLDVAAETLLFSVYSKNAARIEVWIYKEPKGADEVERVALEPLPSREADANEGVWRAALPMARLRAHGLTEAVYYGFRAWGPNWPFDARWTKGSESGFCVDVDDAGNRFNPNKLLIDPCAIEISHDPEPRLSSIDPNECVADYDSGPEWRGVDTGLVAPKSVVPLCSLAARTGRKPRRPLRDEVVYEVHVRGFTMLDPSIPEPYRGTFRGAGMKAQYLRDLGVTAIEFLPVHHFASEQNDDGDPRGDNYWGYMTLGYFAPNRRYSSDRSPGGPTREFKEMVRALHEADIKVFLDVAYNHTGEGLLARVDETEQSRSDDARQRPERARLLCLRGLDNASYYTLRSRPDLDDGRRNQRYQDNSACGPNLNVANPAVRDLVLNSLFYWTHDMGVDGFRFDLAPVLGNCLREDGFAFDWSDPASLLKQMSEHLPLRTDATPDGVDLIAEPWAAGAGTYQLGRFPDGWAEWNDIYRKTVRRAENKLHVNSVRPWQVANALSGSDQQFRQGGATRSAPQPSNSINYVTAHDGHTLRDVFSYTDDDDAWDHGGDRAQQRKAVRNALALLMTSAGVPMLLGGDELFRTQNGRTNAAAIDDESMYLDWTNVDAFLRARAAGDAEGLARLRQHDDVRTYEFARAMLRFRAIHAALRPSAYFAGRHMPGRPIKDLTWYAANGEELRAGWDDPQAGFVAFRIDGASAPGHAEPARSIYVGYCWRDSKLDVVLPSNLPRARWHRVVDTAEWMEPSGNFDAAPGAVIAETYRMHQRSVIVLVEQQDDIVGVAPS